MNIYKAYGKTILIVVIIFVSSYLFFPASLLAGDSVDEPLNGFLHKSSPLPATDVDRELLLREAAGKVFDQQVPHEYGFDVGHTKIVEDWALLGFRVKLSNEVTETPNWETKIALAQWNGEAWIIALENSAEFISWLAQAPESLISAGAKQFLNPSASIMADAPGLWLPFPVGQTWKYISGPHGDLTREGVDFGPFQLGERVNPDPSPTMPLTGRERDVTAAATGIVVDRDANLLIIRHNSDPIWETGYFALAAASNTRGLGQLVFQGERIGAASSEGTYQRDNHVHFWVRRDKIDQVINSQVLSDWQIFQDNGYEVGQNRGRIVYRDGDERVDCETVERANLPQTRCHVHHYVAVADPLPALSVMIEPTSTITVPVGSNGISTIMVHNAQDLYKMRLKLVYTPANLVEVIDAFPGTPGVQVIPGTVPDNQPFKIIQNQVDLDNGIIEFEAELQAPAPAFDGSGSLIEITWERKAVGDVDIMIDEILLTDSNNRPFPLDAPPDPVVIKSGFLVTGQVELQGRADWSGVIVDSGSRQMETDDSGRFRLGLAGNGQWLSLTRPGYLSAQAKGELNGLPDGDQLDLGYIELAAGDINNDNLIDILDLAFISGRYDNNDPLADLTGDGRVDLFDLVLVAANYGQEGPITDWNK